MKLLTLLALLLSLNVYANQHLAPPNLNLSRNVKAVFVDFLTSSSVITYDIKTRSAIAKTTIKFVQEEKGNPVFDLTVEPLKVLINSELATTSTSSMNSVSTIRYINKVLEHHPHPNPGLGCAGSGEDALGRHRSTVDAAIRSGRIDGH